MLNQKGNLNPLIPSLIVTVVLLIASLSFGFWAFASRQDYKLNTDEKIAAAVQVEHDKVASAKDKEYAEKAKSPVLTYNGPASYGSLKVSYPRTWSGYVDESGNGGTPVNGYFYPGVVPALNAPSSVFALRFQIIGQSYSSVVSSLSGYQRNGKIQVAAYAVPSVPSVTGVKVTGQLPVDHDKTGTIVILPLRDKTLELWTEGDLFQSDFDTYVIPNVSFSP